MKPQGASNEEGNLRPLVKGHINEHCMQTHKPVLIILAFRLSLIIYMHESKKTKTCPFVDSCHGMLCRTTLSLPCAISK